MTDLSPEARRLLGLARRGDDPLSNDRARLDRRMSQRLTLAAGVTGVTLGSAKVASGAAIATLIGKGVATGLVVTATAFGLWKAADQANLWPDPIASHTVRKRAASPTNAPVKNEPRSAASNDGLPVIAETTTGTTAAIDAADPAVLADAAHTATATGDAEKSTATSSDATPARAVTATSSDATPARAVTATHQPKKDPYANLRGEGQEAGASDPLLDEVAALRDAQQAISIGQSQRALALIADQNRRFAGGALQQERAAARVFALCNLGRQSEARGEAGAFEQRWPRSPLIARVRRACDAEAPK